MLKIGHISVCNFYQIAFTNNVSNPFLIFSLEIMNTDSQLNLAVNYRLQFLNFDFDATLPKFYQKCATVEIKKCKTIVSCQI